MVPLLRIALAKIEGLRQIQQGQLYVALERVTDEPNGLMSHSHKAVAKATFQELKP